MKTIRRLSTTLLLTLLLAGAAAQSVSRQTRARIGEALTEIARERISVATIRVTNAVADTRTLTLYTNINLSYYPFREQNVGRFYDTVRSLLPESYADRRIRLITDGREISDLIPLALRHGVDRSQVKTFVNPSARPLTERIDRPFRPDSGLEGRHIALWQSHGLYFNQDDNTWQWQRARIWQTVEDLFTQSFVIPFLVPMLENAGADVLLPRERDMRPEEVIVDNDDDPVYSTSSYSEYDGRHRWHDGSEAGFANAREVYTDRDNPFRMGTFRQAATVTDSLDAGTVTWRPDIPRKGDYAVYVSYRTLPDSADDALYTVRHAGGQTRVKVNQTMGGGTWIYLGRFPFEKGCGRQGEITLSNLSSRTGRTVTADGVKIGGGMGNIARRTEPENRTRTMDYDYETSGYPRFAEGARYWLQWAGAPDSVYSPKLFADDYKDDYMSRPLWVNYLMGGSPRLPHTPGLGVPIDLALAFHSDAGNRDGDEILGTLGIFYTRDNRSQTFHGGASRYLSRDLTDMVMTQIVNDISALYEPDWVRRGLWNRSYYEARVPAAPTMLLELLSHHNFADMRYGLDPRFRFTVSRAIYKAVLRHVCFQYDTPCIVQPLPVERFAVESEGAGFRLRWSPSDDPLEPSARPDRYVVYTRIDEGGFDNGTLVSDTTYVMTPQPGRLYSFRVTAVNGGGESFPSETLAAGIAPESRGLLLVINGFDRVSAPPSFAGDSLSGFDTGNDFGVPYLSDIHFIGNQYEFRHSQPFLDNNAVGYGASHADFERQVIAGNTFDYPALHGRAALDAGWSFVSASRRAVERGDVQLGRYRTADLILGKQRQTQIGRGAFPPAFRTYTPELKAALESFCAAGGRLLVSGAYAASDNRPRPEDNDFINRTLRYKLHAAGAAVGGRVRIVASPAGMPRSSYEYHHRPNRDFYAAERCDAIVPAGGSVTFMRYDENNLSAGVAYSGAYKTCVLGFPFETLRERSQRAMLMGAVLDFFER